MTRCSLRQGGRIEGQEREMDMLRFSFPMDSTFIHGEHTSSSDLSIGLIDKFHTY